MAVIRPIEARQGLDTAAGSRPSTRLDDSIGQGLRQVGGAISQAGSAFADIEMRRERMKQQMDEFRTDQSFRRFSDDFALEYSKTQQNIDPSGEGFTSAVSGKFNQQAEQFMQTVPENLRPKFAELVKTQRETFLNKASAAEVDQRNTWFRNGITDSHQKLASQVFEDPSNYQAALGDGERVIDMSGLPEVEKVALKKAWKETLLSTKAENYIRTNPSLLTGADTASEGARLTRAIISVESTGNPNAVSSAGAAGLMQVMPDTAREVAKELGDSNFPWVGNDKTVRDYLKNPANSVRYGTHYFNKQLQAFGGDVEAALIAYNGGPARAEKWLNSGRDDSVLPKETRDYYKKVLNAYGQEPVAQAQQRNIPIKVGGQPGRLAADIDGVRPEVLSRFQEVQNVFGKQVPVVSGYRDKERNARAGGAKNSRHMHGDALDLDVRNLSKEERVELIKTASAMGFTGIGVYNNSLHLDMGNRRAWGSNYKGESVPGWAKGAIDEHLTGQAQAKQGSGSTLYLSPEFEGMPLGERIKIYDRAVSASLAAEQDRQAALKLQYDKHKGAMDLGIQTGEVSSELSILQDSILDDSDKATLLKAFRTANKERIETADAMAAFQAGALRVDPYASESKKTVDNVFKELVKTTDATDLQATTENIVQQTGVVPQPALNAIRGGLTSQNVAEVQAAAQSAQRLSTVDPSALSRRDGGKEVQDAADDFSHFVNNLNMTPEQAARRLMESRDPEKQRDRKALEPLAKEFIKDRQDDDLSAMFDDSFLGWRGNPDIGFSPAQRAGIQAEYVSIAEDEFYRANGDAEIAKNRAMETMKRLYGVTSVTGSPTVIKHPPENYWPKLRRSAANSDQDLTYARQQLEADLKELSPNIDMDSVQLVTTPGTDAMVKRGELPGYAVMYKDENGVLQSIPGQLWRPDLGAEGFRINFQQEADRREQQRRVEDARADQERERIRAQDTLEGRDRDASLDNYLDGPPMPPANITPPSQTDQLQEQRQNLMNDAQDRGTLTPQNALSGNDDIFGGR